MKYDAQLLEVGRLLPTASNILIALPTQIGIDMLSAGLALFLSLEQIGKKVAIATDGVVKVGHSHLYGVGQIQNKIPAGTGGNFTITLGGMVASDKTVPSLQSLDWAPSGAEQKDLKLTFHVNPGQKFEPSFVTPAYESSGFDLIFVIGAGNLTDLGSIYSGNAQSFAGAHIVNIGSKANNGQFGATNIVDDVASSLSEIVAQLFPGLQLPFEGDIATNILAGIFEATCNLQSGNVAADTYGVVSNMLRAGGQKPSSQQPAPIQSAPQQTPQPQGFDLSKIFQAPVAPIAQPGTFTMPPVVEPAFSEETPVGETAETVSPEDDWLTPKIYKGKTGLG